MKQPRQRYQLKDMEPGDRFYFAIDKKQTVWQVTNEEPGMKTIAKPSRKDNTRDLDRSVVYLRTVTN